MSPEYFKFSRFLLSVLGQKSTSMCLSTDAANYYQTAHYNSFYEQNGLTGETLSLFWKRPGNLLRSITAPTGLETTLSWDYPLRTSSETALVAYRYNKGYLKYGEKKRPFNAGIFTRVVSFLLFDIVFCFFFTFSSSPVSSDAEGSGTKIKTLVRLSFDLNDCWSSVLFGSQFFAIFVRRSLSFSSHIAKGRV